MSASRIAEDRIFRLSGAVKRDPAIGAWMSRHAGELEGSGKFMRHVKLRPGGDIDATALIRLVESAYTDMKNRYRG